MTVWRENVDVPDLSNHSLDLNPTEQIYGTLKITINQNGIWEIEAMAREVVSYFENINHDFLRYVISSLTRPIDRLRCFRVRGYQIFLKQ